MANLFFFTIKEANLLRKRVRHLLDLRIELLERSGKETVHDLRVASRRVREALDYFQESFPANWYDKLRRPSKRITKSLGSLRETEVNLALVERLHQQDRLNPFTAELLIHSLKQELQNSHQKAVKQIRAKKFSVYEKFLARIKGSRSKAPISPAVLQKRMNDFWNFPLDGVLGDEQLHNLRIRTKKFRYAVEIYDRVHHRNMGRFLRRIRNLQETLGTIHDLFVFANMLRNEIDSWKGQELIPSTLEATYQEVAAEKERLCPRAKQLYDRVIFNAPEEIRIAALSVREESLQAVHKPQNLAGELPDQHLETIS